MRPFSCYQAPSRSLASLRFHQSHRLFMAQSHQSQEQEKSVTENSMFSFHTQVRIGMT